jgi:integrase/recombinase XerD
MYNVTKSPVIDDKNNQIRKQIEELKSQLPKRTAVRKKLPDFPTYEEYIKLFEEMKRTNCKKEYLVAVILAFEGGMRISEIIGHKKTKNPDGTISWKVPPLTPDRIDLQGHQIKIISGKGGKDRVVPLPKPINERSLKLFPLKVSRRSIQWYITNLSKEVLGRKLSFHKFRHGFGSRLAGKGVPLHEIQMLMGHSRLDTTGIYLHANPQQAIQHAMDVF